MSLAGGSGLHRLSGAPGRVLVLTALATCVVGCDASTRQTGPPSSAGTIAVDVAEIWYQSIGSGRPIIAVHGGPGLDHTYLMPGLAPLGESHRLILYDQRGLGSSITPLDSAAVNMTRFLDDIDAIRERVAGTARVTLLAHSWGTIPALLYAMRWPGRVEGLILVSPVEPGQRFAELTAERQAGKRLPEDVAAMDSISRTAAFRQGDRRARNQFFFHVFRGTFSDPAVADSTFRPRLLERTTVQGQLVTSLLMTPIAGLDFWAQLPELDVPILLVHGVDDPIPLEMVRELADSLPSASLVEVPAAGHFPWVESPEPTFAAIAAFLEGPGAGS